MSCCDSRDDRVLRVFPEEKSGTSYIDTAYNLLQNVVNFQGQNDSDGISQLKERVVWTKIERWTPCKRCIESSELSFGVLNRLPFFLITIALENSLQLWILHANGACDLVCSLGGEDIRVFQHLSCPKTGCHNRRGPLAIKVSSNVGLEVASFLNLRSFDDVEKIHLPKSILHVLNNDLYITFSIPEEIFVYANDDTFSRLFVVSSCYYDSAINTNPMALGTEWLAFSDSRLVQRYECGGGISVDANSQLSYTSALISGAQSLAKGLISITGSITAALTRSPSNSPGVGGSLVVTSPDIVNDSSMSLSAGTPPSTYLSSSAPDQHNSQFMSLQPQQATKHPGVVTIINCKQFACSQTKSRREAALGLVAHFAAHTGVPLACLEFSPNGSLLATADVSGREFNVFRILAHPSSVSLAAVHHLYTLHRGDTTASVVEMSFSPDSRWLVVGTHRGTAHVFPVTPYGGAITRRTHCCRKVPNRFSRFHQSAGLDTLQSNSRYAPQHPHQQQGMLASPRSNSSPLAYQLSHSPKAPSINSAVASLTGVPIVPQNNGSSVTALAYPSRLNARLPPYPHPVPVRALYQIKQTISIPGLDLVNTPTNPTTTPPLSASSNISTSLPVGGGMSSLSVAVNNWLPAGVPTAISVAFSPVSLFRPTPQLISAAVSLGSLSGGGLSKSLGRGTKSGSTMNSTTLCMITWQGDLIEYKLIPRVSQHVAPEKLCEDSPIELECQTLARWPLVSQLQAAGSVGGVPGPLYSHAESSSVCPCAITFGGTSIANKQKPGKSKPKQQKLINIDDWISQVETFTCSSSSRRIWSSPQFSVQQLSSSDVDPTEFPTSNSPRRSSSVATNIAVQSNQSISLSTSPNVYQSEDSAFGDQERVITPSSSAGSSASGFMNVLSAPQPHQAVNFLEADVTTEVLEEIQREPVVEIAAEPDADLILNESDFQSVSSSKKKKKKNKKKHSSGLIDSCSESANEIMDGNLESKLLAAAVQDLQF